MHRPHRRALPGARRQGSPVDRRRRLMAEARGRVLAAMSGGVDSSVAAATLAEQGYEVIGATMKLFCYGDDVPDRPCCSLDSIDDARRVCERIGIPHYVLNLGSAFGRDVIENFVSEYAAGRTPIPCVRCNTFTKFRDLLRKADALECDWIATGHYARVHEGELLRGADRAKDQSYFLWGIDRAVVRRMLLPVGTLTKAHTRRRAHALGLDVVAEKRESQDICFVPGGRHREGVDAHPRPHRPAAAAGRFVGSGRPGVRRARRLRAVHGGPAPRPPRRLARAALRDRHPPGHTRRGDRTAPRAPGPRCDRARGELARRRAARRRRPRPSAGPPPRPRRARRDPARRWRRDRARAR